MKHLVIGSMVAAFALVSSVAAAQEYAPPPRYRYLGMQFDVSAPSGLALGIDGRLPYVPWLKLGVAGTMTLAPGVRGSLLVDPIPFAISPVANFDVGYQSPITVKQVSGSFTYEDLQCGLAFGSRGGFRFLMLAGMSHLSGDVSGLQHVITASDGVSYSNPHFDGWIPSAKVGFVALF
jgi:hypothetical protein